MRRARSYPLSSLSSRAELVAASSGYGSIGVSAWGHIPIAAKHLSLCSLQNTGMLLVRAFRCGRTKVLQTPQRSTRLQTTCCPLTSAPHRPAAFLSFGIPCRSHAALFGQSRLTAAAGFAAQLDYCDTLLLNIHSLCHGLTLTITEIELLQPAHQYFQSGQHLRQLLACCYPDYFEVSGELSPTLSVRARHCDAFASQAASPSNDAVAIDDWMRSLPEHESGASTNVSSSFYYSRSDGEAGGAIVMDHMLSSGMWAPVESRLFHHIIQVRVDVQALQPLPRARFDATRHLVFEFCSMRSGPLNWRLSLSWSTLDRMCPM